MISHWHHDNILPGCDTVWFGRCMLLPYSLSNPVFQPEDGGRQFLRNSCTYLFLNINQLDALNFIISLFHASTCFEHMCLSSGGQKLYYTVSGTITLIGGRTGHRTATYRCYDTRGCIVQFWPPDDEHMCSKHVQA